MKKLLIFVLILIAFNSYANIKDTPPKPIPGGKIYAGAEFRLMYRATGILKITCDIINPNYQKQYPIILGMDCREGQYSQNTNQFKIIFNGKNLNISYGQNGGIKAQALLNFLTNTLEIDGITSENCGAGLFFINYDNSDTATIKNCYAALMTN